MAQDAKPEKAALAPEKKAAAKEITKAESEELQKIIAQAQKAGKLQQEGVEGIESALDDKELSEAARKLQTGLLLGKKIDQKFQVWREEARKAHDCPKCELSQDGKTLAPPKSEDKPPAK